MDLLITISRATLGMAVLIGIGYLMSSHKKSIAWRTIFLGILLQFVLAVLVLKVPFINKGFDYAAGFFQVILKFSEEGATFLFGNLVSDTKSFGYIFANHRIFLSGFLHIILFWHFAEDHICISHHYEKNPWSDRP